MHVQRRRPRVTLGSRSMSPMTTRLARLAWRPRAMSRLPAVDRVEEPEDTRRLEARGWQTILQRARSPLIQQLLMLPMSAAVMAMAASTISSRSGGRVAILGQPGAHLLEPLHADQVGGQPCLALAQRFFI